MKFLETFIDHNLFCMKMILLDNEGISYFMPKVKFWTSLCSFVLSINRQTYR